MSPTLARCGARTRSISTACTCATRVGEVAREHADARPDLEHDVVGLQLGEPADHAEDVLVDEEVLPELLLRRDLTSPKHGASRCASICRPSSAASSPRASASAASVCTTYAGSFALAAHRLRREVRAVGLGEEPVGGNLRRGEPQVGALLVGDVAGERDVPAALERRRRAGAARRSSAARRVPSKPARRASVSSSAARVWITTGLPSSAARSSCCVEELAAARRAARSRGSSRARSPPPRPRVRVGEQRAQLVDVGVGARRPRADGCRRRRRPRRAARRARAPRAPATSVPIVRIARHAGVARARERPRLRRRACRGARACRSRAGRASSSSSTVSGGELPEERLRLAQRLTRRQLARRPLADPARVVAGQHLVGASRPPRRTSRNSSGPASQPSWPSSSCTRLRRERQERREERLQRVDATQRDVENRRRPLAIGLHERPGACSATYWFASVDVRIASAIAARNRPASMRRADLVEGRRDAVEDARRRSVSSPGCGHLRRSCGAH